MSGTVVWGYAESELAERWEGEYDTREAAVVAGREHFAGSEAYADMTHFWVVRGRRPAASEFLPPYYEDALADDTPPLPPPPRTLAPHQPAGAYLCYHGLSRC